MLLRRATGHFVRLSNLILFSGLISYIVVALRFLLGATEGSVTACMQLFFFLSHLTYFDPSISGHARLQYVL